MNLMCPPGVIPLVRSQGGKGGATGLCRFRLPRVGLPRGDDVGGVTDKKVTIPRYSRPFGSIDARYIV